MINPFRILWRSLVDVYEGLFPMVGMNLLWLLISIPIVFVATLVLMALGLPNVWAFSVALLFGVMAPNPASVGIHNYANPLVKEDRVEFDLFWSGLRTMWRRSLALSAIGLAGLCLLGVNIYFYLTNAAQMLHYFAILWIYGLIFWSIMLLFMNALLVEQESKSIKLVVRNAFLLALDNLVPSLVIFVILTIVSILSIGITLLIALVGGSFVVVVETRAVLAFLEKYRARVADQPTGKRGV
jgi:uncharacterized membrane protein YesL